MKKSPILTALLTLVITLTGCSSPTTSDILNSDYSSISHILTNNANPPLTAGSFIENEATGIPQSYEELQDFIRPYSSVNYLEYEIIKRYSSEEAFEITNDDMFLYGATLYDIHVVYDCINDQQLDIYTKLSSAGTVEEQFEGYPPYLEGDKFACNLILMLSIMNLRNYCLLLTVKPTRRLDIMLALTILILSVRIAITLQTKAFQGLQLLHLHQTTRLHTQIWFL